MKAIVALAAGLSLLAAASCHEGGVGPDPDAPILSALTPANQAVGVSVGTDITLQFSHPMAAAMEAYVVLHEGDLAGPVAPVTRTWSADRTRLVLTPEAPLRARTTYTLHIGGGMRGADGRPLNFEWCRQQFGGAWVPGSMRGGGAGMMGPGWRHANGTYGMVFTFTTA